MNSQDIRQKYIDFFVNKADHKQIPSAPIVPPDDPTTLFTGSGMQQLVPFLKGEKHPMGTRLVDSQPCFRAEDIEEVGDNRHTTFFEMLGNWSLGDYFKKEQLSWCWEFFTKVLNLPNEKLHVSLFEGNDQVEKDLESYKIWKDLGVSDDHIHYYDATKNWWSRAGAPDKMPAGEIGGTTSEVFFDCGAELNLHQNSKFKNKECHINCDCGRFLEIGNSVFMEYVKQEDGSIKALPKQNVDFGGGLERLAAATQNTPDVFSTDLFQPIIKEIEKVSSKQYQEEYAVAMRIIADHIRAATLMMAQGIAPGNKTQGYFVRRLIRRAALNLRNLDSDISNPDILTQAAIAVREMFDGIYFEKTQVEKEVISQLQQEVSKFSKALNKGLAEIEKVEVIDEQLAFNLFQSYGFPFEITQEIVKEKGASLNQKKFDELKQKHSQQSRTASTGMFKGGLADHSEDVTKLHTATHLLHKSLQVVLGSQVKQEGSNITASRLRFDYHQPEAPTPEQIKEIESLINQKIQADLPVHKTIEDKKEALESGAMAFFKETYPSKVSVYTIGKNPSKDWFSKELCGGPHVNSTGEIGAVTIKKDKSIGANTRRIYVVLSSAHGNKKHSSKD